MPEYSFKDLNNFILRAKANSYVGRAAKSLPSRLGSHDIQFADEKFQYLDSYFGGTDFVGQELVWFENEPIWAMNYYGRIIIPSIYDAERAGQTIIASLAKLYETGRFLGGFSYETKWGNYFDSNKGDIASFTGYEWIEFEANKVYELHYHGGLIKP